ncbi:MAG TPA: His/Gly/Thr/Pro-type tRNA ligase C-terminal domain-containing protein, partial [Bacilli bacterium]|nr:His/Gly/Thr/Pro-type tRNA ligase C-terminal domain-containing protein [Bacilli bacterium]
QLGLKNNKLINIDEQFPAQDILCKTGQLEQFSSGIYAYGHIPFLVKENIKNVIRKVLTEHGCSEISLPLLQPESLWISSGRLDRYIKDKVMFRCLTEKGNYCLAPTAEEAVLEFAKSRLSSYKDLPRTYFQIGEKFRDELRPRGFLLRGKSFEMLDAYSFGKDEKDLDDEYENMRKAYFDIFNELELSVLPVAADSGAIGGDKSEEFMVISNIGEDNVWISPDKKDAYNEEVLEKKNINTNGYEKVKAVELGHIFALKDKYSKSMNGTFINEEDKPTYYQMGCYGIGVSRTLAMIYENSITKDQEGNFTGLALPKKVAPYKLYIIAKDDRYEEAINFYNKLINMNIPVIFDDSKSSIGYKIKTNEVVGCPYMVLFGDKTEKGMAELENNKTKEKQMLSLDEIIKSIK